MTKYLCILALFASCCCYSAQPRCTRPATHTYKVRFPRANLLTIAQAIGWVPSTDPLLLCGGFYAEPLLSFISQGLIKANDTHTNADYASVLPGGCSVLKGHVRVQQPGKQLTADVAHIYRQRSTGTIQRVDLFGNVYLHEPSQLFIAESAHLQLDKHTGIINHVLYRFAHSDGHSTGSGIKHLYGSNGWGQARRVIQLNKDEYELEDGTYTTCAPPFRSWELRAKHIKINRASGKGVARGAQLRIHNVPILYSPYFSFPIDDKRKSGFLNPTFSYSTQSGVEIGLPYYFNLAPNYDFTFFPKYFPERGFMFGGQLRVLTHYGFTEMYASYLPGDKRFARFMRDLKIIGMSNDRKYFELNNTTQINPFLSGGVNFSYIGDDYYLQDFTHTIESTTKSQLLRQVYVNYHDDHIHFLARAQGFQTLHPLGQAPVLDVFSRVPQLELDANYPNQIFGADLHFHSEYVYFDWPNNSAIVFPSGHRFILHPQITMPLRFVAGYVIPQVELHYTHYDVQQPTLLTSDDRALPIVSLNAGLHLERSLDLFHHHYVHTLEPKLFYLYVPFDNQSLLPLFDSGLYQFTFQQLFRTNRFSGYDRVGDANQLSYALVSSLIDADSGDERLSVGVGQIAYFKDRKVGFCTGKNCAPIRYTSPTDKVSPIAAFLNYHVNSIITASSDITWAYKEDDVNNAGFNLHYEDPGHHIVNLGYAYARNVLVTLANGHFDSQRLHQIYTSTVWPVTLHWSVLGIWSYNIESKHPQTYYAGAEYDSCCWAIRLIAGRTLDSVSKQSDPEFDNSIHVQVLLKGLGTVTNNSPGQILHDNIPGYHDIFV